MKKIHKICFALLLCVCLLFTVIACKPTEPKHEHTYGEWQTVKDANCTQKGEKKRVCSGCKDEEVQEIDALGHNFGTSYVGDATSHWHACTRCGASDSKSAHNFGTTYLSDANSHWRICSLCGEVESKTVHNYVEGKCSACNRMQPTATLVYSKVDGGYSVMGLQENATDTQIVVAEEYEGEPVIAIADSAFSGQPIVSVVLPDSIKSIGNQAFYSCTSLEKFDMGNGVERIGDFAFQQASVSEMKLSQNIKEIGQYALSVMPNWKNVVLPSTLESVGDYAFYGSGIESLEIKGAAFGKGMFRGCASLTSIKFNDDIVDMSAMYIFKDCKALVKVKLPQSLKLLGSATFDGCTALSGVTMSPVIESIGSSSFESTAITSIELPKTLKVIGGSAFQNCKSLTSIDVPSGVLSIKKSCFENSGLQSAVINAVIINEKVFRNCKSLTSVKFGADLKLIEPYAFENCSELSNVDMSEKSTKGLDIQQYAFKNCTALQSLTLNSRVLAIRPNAFDGCSALTSVEFMKDTDTEWYTLKIINNTYDYTWQAFGKEELEPTLLDISDPQANATALKSTTLFWRNKAIIYDPTFPQYPGLV